jgi:hypothetical protein
MQRVRTDAALQREPEGAKFGSSSLNRIKHMKQAFKSGFLPANLKTSPGKTLACAHADYQCTTNESQ